VVTGNEFLGGEAVPALVAALLASPGAIDHDLTIASVLRITIRGIGRAKFGLGFTARVAQRLADASTPGTRSFKDSMVPIRGQWLSR
jgi:hypothetical protein